VAALRGDGLLQGSADELKWSSFVSRQQEEYGVKEKAPSNEMFQNNLILKGGAMNNEKRGGQIPIQQISFKGADYKKEEFETGEEGKTDNTLDVMSRRGSGVNALFRRGGVGGRVKSLPIRTEAEADTKKRTARTREKTK